MEQQNENITKPNSSMEELKIEEDENVKENSLEDDILGAQSLLMSESDEEGDADIKRNKSPQKKISPKRPARILDSDDDLDSKEANEQTLKEEKLSKKKILTIVDSDSDIEQNNAYDKKTETAKNLVEYIEDDGREDVWKNFKNEVESSKLNVKPKYKKSKRVKKVEQLKEDGNDLESINNNLKKTKQGFSLVDSDSSDSEAEVKESDLEASAKEANFEENNNENSKEKVKKIKVMRASAKKALDEMQAIQSEQQRLHREALISIPYHKPRKHTLDEFLKRRTIIQPQKASPVAAAIQTRNLKMTSEELEEYAELMEERAKEATEFFKSESENEEEVVFKDNEGVMDKPATAKEENIPTTSEQPLEVQNETQLEGIEKPNEANDELTENQDGVQLTEEDLKDILAEEKILRLGEQQERPTCSKVLITEVIELPKLDMNTVKTSPVKKHTPRSSLNIKQLLAEKNLSESPSLSGAPNKLIDLDTGNLIDKKPSGMENLLKRLMSTIKAKKVKNSETCNILSIENGKLEMSKVNITRSETKDPQKDSKPGAAYFELKKNLKDIIRKKRLEEINKKQDDELEYNKCLADEDSEEEETEDIVEEYEPDYKPEKNFVIDEEENALVANNENEETSGEEENAENGTDDEEEDQIDDEDEQDNESTIALEKSQRKSRIIKAFDDSEEEGENDDIDFLKTQPQTTQPALFETQISVQNSLADDENELMALCSGTFNETQKVSGDALMSQIPITQNCGNPLNDNELMELCSGTFDQPVETQQQTEKGKISESLKTKVNKILSTDEENDEEQINADEINIKKIKKLTKRQKKKKTKLGFSDDEDDEEESQYDEEDVEEEETIDDNFDTAGDEPETFVDYDSEENEILVQMTKNDKVKQAQNFVEKEAELSESEWGSADEDENNLDKYDFELGDEDEFDKDKLQTELGQIHARKMMDEDIREVRKIQELLFEDEEKDGVGRQRTFKWKNAESGFSLEDGRPLDDVGDNQNGDSGDEINEHQWRKVRYEREQFLKQQGLKPDSQDMSTLLTNTSLPLNNSISVAVTSKKIQIITAKKTTVSSSDTKRGSPFLISKGISSMHKKSVRGSFLVRDKETLSKLAGLTKGNASSIAVSDMDDTAGSVSIKNVRPNNFVFATLTEEEHENLKRKADDLLNSSNENGKDFMKKPKIEPRRDKCFIDQLL